MGRLQRKTLGAQSGQMLMITLVIVGLGTLVVGSTLAFVSASLDSIGNAAERAEVYYAAEAGIEAVVADMRQGADPIDGGYALPVVTTNGLTPVITIATPPSDLPRIRVFVDPNTTTDMAPLGPGNRFIYIVDGVSDSTPIEFTWNYTPTNPGPGTDTRIEIFEGVSTDTADRIRNNTDNNSPHTHTLGAGANDGGTFTFRFTNESAVSLTSEPFGDEGEANRTWMSMEAGIDYIVTSTVGDLSLRAYLQQGPGGTTSAQRTVAVAGWLRLDN